MNEVKLAIHFLECILSNKNNYTREGFLELFEIKNGNKELALEHLKAIYDIIGIAIKEMENE